jgi:Protein of unknown function (DUF998)
LCETCHGGGRSPRPSGSLVHAVWAGAGFGGLIMWPVFARQRAARVPRGLRPVTCLYATITLSLLMVWFAVEEASRGAQMGLAERVAGVAQTLWPLAVVVSCRRNRLSQSGEPVERCGGLARTETSNNPY